MGEREALSAAEAAGRGVRGGGCARLVRDEAGGHAIGGSPQARMRAGGGHRPLEGMRRRLRAGAAAVEEQRGELMVCGASFGAVVAVILTVLALFVPSGATNCSRVVGDPSLRGVDSSREGVASGGTTWFSRSCFSPNCIKWDSPETRQSFALWFPQTSCSTLAGLLLLVACWGKSS